LRRFYFTTITDVFLWIFIKYVNFGIKNPKFRQKSKWFSSKIKIFVKDQNFVKTPNFRQKSKFSSKIQIFVKNPNFRPKLNFSSKVQFFVKNCQIFSSKIEIIILNIHELDSNYNFMIIRFDFIIKLLYKKSKV